MRLTVIAAIAAGVVGALLYFGIVSKSEMRAAAEKARGDLGQAAQKIGSGWEGEQPKDVALARQCQDMLKRIESAKRAVAQERGQAIGTVAWDDALGKMGLGAIPQCPAGGSYSLNSLGQTATCSIGANQTSRKEDDHIIKRF